jgi:hypothetical protein
MAKWQINEKVVKKRETGTLWGGSPGMCCSMCEVICGRMVLGVVVGDVVGAFVPVEAKLALRLATS